MFIFSIFCITLKVLPLHFYVVCPEDADRTNLSNTMQCTCTLGSLNSNQIFFSKSFNRNEVDREFTTQTLLMKSGNHLIAALISKPTAHFQPPQTYIYLHIQNSPVLIGAFYQTTSL